jgi:hypothetical protein
VETNIFVLARELEEREHCNCYHVTAITLHYISALLHNTQCCGEKLLLPEIIALAIKKPLTLLIVIALVTSSLLSPVKLIALIARQKRCNAVTFWSNVAGLWLFCKHGMSKDFISLDSLNYYFKFSSSRLADNKFLYSSPLTSWSCHWKEYRRIERNNILGNILMNCHILPTVTVQAE